MKLSGKLYNAAFVISVAFLSLVWGVAAAHNKKFPDRLLVNAYRGWNTFWHTAVFASPGDRWLVVPDSNAGGVLRYDPERAYKGYTLFTSGGVQAGFLVDMAGTIKHEWHLPFRRVWNRNAAVSDPAPAEKIQWRDVYLYPNGDLLAVYEAPSYFPFGYGLVKMDRNSHPLWAYLDHVHHDVDVGPDGKVYTLTQAVRTRPFVDMPELPMPAVEDFAVELSPEGQPLKKISIFDAFAKSSYRSVTEVIMDWNSGDHIHTNAISAVTPEVAKRLPFARAGEVLLSFRNLDGIALLDFDTEKIEWFQSGPWRHQHDPEMLENGHMLIFDNDGDLARGGRARVLEFDPSSLEIFWQYPGNNRDLEFDSPLGGSEQLLPNGNILITESGKAEILEVTRDRQVVWDYQSPLRVGAHKKMAGMLLAARRFRPDELNFDFRGK